MPKKLGGKNRKYGRRKKKPSQQRYTSERRWEKNKRKKAQTRATRTNQPIKIKLYGNWITIAPTK